MTTTPPTGANAGQVTRAIAAGGLVVGVLDGLDAVVFFGLRGVPPPRIFQSIAAGLLGPASFRGGAATVTLGVALHFLIATAVVVVYYLAARRARTLTDRPVAWGAAYGIVVYLVMNFVVIPLSALSRSPIPLPVLLNGLAIHVLGVGIPAALFASRARELRPR
jgi:hypothetical protein